MKYIEQHIVIKNKSQNNCTANEITQRKGSGWSNLTLLSLNTIIIKAVYFAIIIMIDIAGDSEKVVTHNYMNWIVSTQ